MRKQKSDTGIDEAFANLRPKMLGGILSAHLLLTPPDVKRVTTDKHSTKKLGILQPRCEFKFSTLFGSTALHENVLGSRTTSERKTIGIYQGSLKFPPYCCECMKPAKRHEVVELTVIKNPGKFDLSNTSQQEAELISTALCCSRYWYAVPFCSEHGLESQAIGFQEADDNFIFKFANEEYGKLLAKLNHMEMKWMDKSVMKVRLLSNIGFIASLFCATQSAVGFFGGIIAYGIVMAVLCLAFAISSLIYRLKRGRGEKIPLDDV